METNAVPQVGSLSARIIRACPAHAECALECPQRTVEDLGQIASFDVSRVLADAWNFVDLAAGE